MLFQPVAAPASRGESWEGILQGGRKRESKPAVTYAVMTLLLIGATLLLLNQLSRVPLAQLSFGDPIPLRWRAYTDATQTYTLNLPPGWEERPLTEPTITAVLPALRPLVDFAHDEKVIFLAQGAAAEASPPPFVVIAQSQELAALTEEAAADLPQVEGVSVLQSAAVEDAGKSHLALNVLVAGIRCQQQFVPGKTVALLVAACVSEGDYSSQRTVVRDLLDSFQYLRRDE